MRVLVATITHRADDARIFARQMPALLDAGIDVTALAPWRASKVTPDSRITAIDVPRTRGLRRVWPLITALRAIRRTPADLVLVHDPELAFALARTNTKARVVWDVHEDLAAALRSKTYLPRWLRPILAAYASRFERHAATHLGGLLLAEERYADRFTQKFPIVLNLPRVPQEIPPATVQNRVVYVGSITRARGLLTMLDIAKNLESDGISLMLIGEVPSVADQALIAASPNVTWTGPLPNSHALELVQESLAGLSLLSDVPNYRHSMPTKVIEYMSRGVPVISTPLSVAVAALDGSGIIVPFDSHTAVTAAVTAIRDLRAKPEMRTRMRDAAFARVQTHYNWDSAQQHFVEALRQVAGVV